MQHLYHILQQMSDFRHRWMPILVLENFLQHLELRQILLCKTLQLCNSCPHNSPKKNPLSNSMYQLQLRQGHATHVALTLALAMRSTGAVTAQWGAVAMLVKKMPPQAVKCRQTFGFLASPRRPPCRARAPTSALSSPTWSRTWWWKRRAWRPTMRERASRRCCCARRSWSSFTSSESLSRMIVIPPCSETRPAETGWRLPRWRVVSPAVPITAGAMTGTVACAFQVGPVRAAIERTCFSAPAPAKVTASARWASVTASPVSTVRTARSCGIKPPMAASLYGTARRIEKWLWG
mmetsp:Transcript_24697/g.46811  ORF Transcript_24697/g.46811 Transcript_24697/m.46811 type:complete len:293 (-) Transcript_24697:336-1214(-)